MATKKNSKAITKAVAIRDFVDQGEIKSPGMLYEGPQARYLIAIGKCRPFDPAVEMVKDGMVVARPKAEVAPRAIDYPDETWAPDEIREWLKGADPDAKLPKNMGKSQMLEMVAAIIVEREVR